MNSESGRRLSLEELKQLNRSQSQVPPKPPAEPARQDRENLLAALTALYRLESTNSDRLERLEASVGPQEALLRALSRQVGQLPTRTQREALAGYWGGFYSTNVPILAHQIVVRENGEDGLEATVFYLWFGSIGVGFDSEGLPSITKPLSGL